MSFNLIKHIYLTVIKKNQGLDKKNYPKIIQNFNCKLCKQVWIAGGIGSMVIVKIFA